MSSEATVSWCDRAFVAEPEVAAIFARPRSWVRDAIDDGDLHAVRSGTAGPLLICVESMIALRERLRAAPSATTAVRRKLTSRRPKLQLVWTNPQLK